MIMDFNHVSVLLHESIEALDIKPDGIYVDCTAGGGGHSFEIASRLHGCGRLIAIDRDDDAIAAATARLAPFKDRVTVVRRNFADVSAVLDELGIDKIHGALLDLGVSSKQLDDSDRGFSYMNDAPLDMRMDRTAPLSAEIIVNTYPESELYRIIRDYGEEKFASRIARRIVEAREKEPIKTTLQLSEIITAAIPEKNRRSENKHPAKRSFQAIRIETNGELEIISDTLKTIAERLAPGGRTAVITFHSLEDRIVKNTFAELCRGCDCPPDFPVCVCGKTPVAEQITRKPTIPSDEELETNPRARSAKLRVIGKI